MEFKKQSINFDSVSHWSANEKFKRDQPHRAEVSKEYKKLTGDDLENFSDPINQAYNYFENTAVDNIMALDAKTYCELKKIDLSSLRVAVSKFLNIPEPKAEDFTTFTINTKANERLDDLHALIAAFNKYATANDLNPNLLVKAMQGRLRVDGTIAPEYINLK
jgi:hypothetical protein